MLILIVTLMGKFVHLEQLIKWSKWLDIYYSKYEGLNWSFKCNIALLYMCWLGETQFGWNFICNKDDCPKYKRNRSCQFHACNIKTQIWRYMYFVIINSKKRNTQRVNLTWERTNKLNILKINQNIGSSFLPFLYNIRIRVLSTSSIFTLSPLKEEVSYTYISWGNVFSSQFSGCWANNNSRRI